VRTAVVLRLRVVITDLSGVGHELGDELIFCRLRLAHQRSDDFELHVNNENDQYGSVYVPGCRADFYVDDSPTPSTRVLVGVVEEALRRRPSKNENVLVLRGRELFHVIAGNRYVVEVFKDREISSIVRELVEKYAPEIDASSHIEDTGITLEDIRFPYRTLKDCLDLLSSLAGYTYHCDPELKLHFYPLQAKSSGLTFTEADIAPTPELVDDLTPVKNVVYVLGGVDLKVDCEGGGEAGYESLHDKWLAQSFVPTRSNMEQLSLLLSRVGDPEEDLFGEIRVDEEGLPVGDVVGAFTYSSDYLSETPSMKPVSLQTVLEAGRKHWIILRRAGKDENNTYRWYHDGGTSGENAYSMDGSTWTVQQNSHTYAYKTYYGLPIIYVAEDEQAIQTYRRREIVIQDPAIRDMATARRVARAKLEELRQVRRELPRLTVLTPESLPRPGELVRIQMPSKALDAEFLVREVELAFERGPGPAKLTLTLGERRETLEALLAEALKDLQKQKIGTTGIDKKSKIILYRDLEEEFKLSETTEPTPFSTFTVGSSAIGGPDRLG